MTKLQTLKELGFVCAGKFLLANAGNIDYRLGKEFSERTNILYAFILSKRIKYIGVTKQKLQVRIRAYCKPGKDPRTNLRIRDLLCEELQCRKSASVYVLPGNDWNRKYRGYRVDLAAGLESTLIQEFETLEKSGGWNKRC